MKDHVMAAAVIAVLFCLIFPVPTTGSIVATGTPVLDGEISEGEYEHAADLSDGDFLIRWLVQDDTVFFAISARTDGYVAIGFDPEFLMKGADMIVGWVSGDGNATVIDAYSSGQFGPVVQDTEQGGTDDILGYAGAAEGGWTVIEFSRALSTGDQCDKDIPADGELVVMWATGSVFDPSIMPEDGGMGTISMSSGEMSEAAPTITYLLALMLAALATSIAALLMLLFRSRVRIKAHLALGAATAGLTSCAALIVVLPGTAEITAGLAYPLLSSAALVVATALIGAAALRKEGRTWWSKGHLLAAAAAMIALAGSLLSAFFL